MGPNLAPTALQGPQGPQKGLLEPKLALLGAVEVLKRAQVHDMDASHPGTLCGCVFDAIRPVSAVPGAQRGHFFFRDPAIIWKKGKLGAFGSAGASLLLGEK